VRKQRAHVVGLHVLLSFGFAPEWTLRDTLRTLGHVRAVELTLPTPSAAGCSNCCSHKSEKVLRTTKNAQRRGARRRVSQACIGCSLILNAALLNTAINEVARVQPANPKAWLAEWLAKQK